MRNALGTQTSGTPALAAQLADLRRQHVQIRANCARQSEAAIEMRKAAAVMRASTERQRVLPR